MDARKYFLSKGLAASGAGLIGLAVVIFLMKVLLDIAYFAAAALALAGLVLMLIGWIIRRA